MLPQPPHASLRSRLAALALAGALTALGGCKSTSRQVQGPGKELSAAELQELLAKGTIKPVTEMEGDDPFGGVDGSMEDTHAEELAAKASSQGGAANATEPEPPVVAPPPRLPDPPENPYVRFGTRIRVYPDGTITKPYPLRVGTGKKLQELIQSYGNFPLWTAEAGNPSPPTLVKLDLMEKWDIELYQDLRNAGVATGTEAPLADWLVVTAGPDLLEEVEDFINLFAAGVPQIEIEAKIVEITLSDIFDIGVRPPTGVPMFQFPGTAFVKSFDSNMPNVANAVEGVLSVGGVQDAVTFNAQLEALAINDNVSIISRPKIAVREGGRADILNTSRIPYLNITGVNNAGGFANAAIAFQEVGVKLYVVPRVVGTQTVALNIDVEQSQVSGTETVLVTASDSPVQVPVISLRSARTVVYLQPGQAVILGGLITERSVENERKIPFLGDIPLLGHLFKATYKRKEQTNVLFFIRPRILQGVDLNRQF